MPTVPIPSRGEVSGFRHRPVCRGTLTGPQEGGVAPLSALEQTCHPAEVAKEPDGESGACLERVGGRYVEHSTLPCGTPQSILREPILTTLAKHATSRAVADLESRLDSSHAMAFSRPSVSAFARLCCQFQAQKRVSADQSRSGRYQSWPQPTAYHWHAYAGRKGVSRRVRISTRTTAAHRLKALERGIFSTSLCQNLPSPKRTCRFPS